MKVTAHGPVHRSEAEWRTGFKQYEGSGLGPAAFCARAGIVLSSFQKWAQRLGDASAERAPFVELAPPAMAADWAVEFAFPSGVVLRVRG